MINNKFTVVRLTTNISKKTGNPYNMAWIDIVEGFVQVRVPEGLQVNVGEEITFVPHVGYNNTLEFKLAKVEK